MSLFLFSLLLLFSSRLPLRRPAATIHDEQQLPSLSGDAAALSNAGGCGVPCSSSNGVNPANSASFSGDAAAAFHSASFSGLNSQQTKRERERGDFSHDLSLVSCPSTTVASSAPLPLLRRQLTESREREELSFAHPLFHHLCLFILFSGCMLDGCCDECSVWGSLLFPNLGRAAAETGLFQNSCFEII
ncbi:hypothetical protein AXF42_Ash020663 [Apostasia shenzhenica]|uniref:Uncharacterized protein n=1 Tax=Apostasia shenzhenica TaxID=1088818 RepID=A0A2H9ZW42_9ASPA|nr:hypothetical protein AXF42_Ash020663 [Apostasia shenzhenica]